MSETRAKTALIIPVHNRRDTTLQGLRSLSKANRIGLDVKIFVVDDGSTDGTSAAIRSEFPDVELVSGDGTLHYAGGTNRGIEAALRWNPEFVVTMNDDSIFHEDFLVRLVETARRSHKTIVGSLLLLWNEPHRVFQVGPRWISIKGGWTFTEYQSAFSVPTEPFDVECLVGNCVLFPAEAIKANGLMDEKNFSHGWGDAQYLMRMRKAGWRLVVDPRSRVWCEPNTYPPPLHAMSVRERLYILLRKESHPLNLKRQWKARWHSAPSKPEALFAFASYLVLLGLKAAHIVPFARSSDIR